MNYQKGLLASYLLGATGLLAFTIIIIAIDPTKSDWYFKSAFFVSFFWMLAGMLTPIIFWGRVSAGSRDVLFTYFPVALRQGIIIALLATSLLILQSWRALSFWDFILVLLGAFFVELALRSRK